MSLIEFAAAGRMTEAEYEREREALRATYGDNAIERTGRFEQELARLFARSGWTQDELAKKEDKTQPWVAYRLRFGRFLTFITVVIIPKSLTEGRFRGYWNRTEKEANERQRFLAVQKLMESELCLSKDRSPHIRKHVADAILQTSADGHWHHFDVIVKNAQIVDERVTADDALVVLTQMLTRGTYHTACERRKGGKSWSYRIVRGRGRKVDVDVLLQELSPIVQALKVEGRKHAARWSPGTIAKLAHDLEGILERLAHHTPLESSSDVKE